jgi:ubiquitin C-terminal hydrolase
MTQAEALEQGLLPPAGMVNLINSCYINSVVQVIHKIPEVVESVEGYTVENATPGSSSALVSQLKGTFQELDTSSTAVKPFNLVNVYKCILSYL